METYSLDAICDCCGGADSIYYVQAPGSTQGYNRYSYCLNNPLQWVDPSGERYTGAEPPEFLHEHIREDMWDGGYFRDYLSTGGMSTDRYSMNQHYEMLFHQPHLFTSDGTRYEISYYMAAEIQLFRFSKMAPVCIC